MEEEDHTENGRSSHSFYSFTSVSKRKLYSLSQDMLCILYMTHTSEHPCTMNLFYILYRNEDALDSLDLTSTVLSTRSQEDARRAVKHVMGRGKKKRERKERKQAIE